MAIAMVRVLVLAAGFSLGALGASQTAAAEGCEGSTTTGSYSETCTAPTVSSGMINEQQNLDSASPGSGVTRSVPHTGQGHG